MRRLVVFNNLTLDGYFAAADGDMGWAHGAPDPEFDAFVADKCQWRRTVGVRQEDLRAHGRLLAEVLGEPERAGRGERMNQLPKVVSSRTTDTASWSNTTVVKGELAAAIRRMKNEW